MADSRSVFLNGDCLRPDFVEEFKNNDGYLSAFIDAYSLEPITKERGWLANDSHFYNYDTLLKMNKKPSLHGSGVILDIYFSIPITQIPWALRLFEEYEMIVVKKILPHLNRTESQLTEVIAILERTTRELKKDQKNQAEVIQVLQKQLHEKNSLLQEMRHAKKNHSRHCLGFFAKPEENNSEHNDVQANQEHKKSVCHIL